MHRHRRVLGGAVALALVASLGSGISTANAGPDDDKKKVEKNLDDARKDLDESSSALSSATKELESAQTKLSGAQNKLAKVRGQLAAAQAKDKAMAAKLVSARKSVNAAQASLKRAQDKVSKQRKQINAFAQANYREAGLDGLTVVMQSKSVDDMMARSRVVEQLQQKQRGSLERMNSARAEVASKKAALEAAEKAAEQQKKQAAENVKTQKRLETSAKATELDVEKFFAKRKAAHDKAENAKAGDLARYRALETERKRIEAKLKKIAEQERDKNDDNDDSDVPPDGGGALSKPINTAITSPYGQRFHPVLHIWKLHDGTDFGAGCGTPIRAAASGKVIERYFNGGYGNRLLISHGTMRGSSVVSAYNHMSSYAAGVGDRVERGEVIGYVGTTGYSTGCHLHFMVYKNGSTTNPMNWL